MPQPTPPSSNLYYTESGVVPAVGPAAGLIVGILVSLIGGAVYGYADHYIHFIYIRGFMTFGFGALIGWATAKTMVKAHVRNTGSILLFTLVAAIVGYYTAWIAWLSALFANSNAMTHLFLSSPRWVWHMILTLNALGVWSIQDGPPVSGFALWIVWLIEMGAIFLSALSVARSIARKRPFCENCSQWTVGPRVIASTATLDPADLRERLESRQFDFVPQLPVYNGVAPEYLEWNAYKCEACKDFNALSVVKIRVQRNKRGKTQRTRKTIIDKLLIAAPDLDRLQTRPVPAPAPPTTAPLPDSALAPTPPIPPEPKREPKPSPPDDLLLDL
jgi:hypothetical protein